jgi:DNA-binding transcriptional regulator PaaX
MADSGEIDKIIRNSIPLFRLTGKGRDRLLSFFPISIGQKRVWDRIWRLAIISSIKVINKNKFSSKRTLAESCELRKLKTNLIKMGFRALSRGIYLTPLPISAKLREFLITCKFNAQIEVIESRRLLFGDDKQLAKRIWDLEQLHNRYSQLIKAMVRLLTTLDNSNHKIYKEKTNIFLIYKNYFHLLESDPGMPMKLLTADWPANLAKEKFLKLAQLLDHLASG